MVDSYVNFQHGVLVNYMSGDPAYKGIYPFGNLSFHYEQVEGYGSDCEAGICGSQDVYTYLDVSTPAGPIVSHFRSPSDGDGGASFTIGQDWPIGVANGARNGGLTVNVAVEGWDADDTS